MKKRKLASVLAVVLLAGICIGAAAAWHSYTDYGWVLEANWDLLLPAEAGTKEVFQQDSGPSPHGDGIRYHVFSYKKEEPIRDLVAWQTEEQATLHTGSYSEAAERWLDDIGVPAEERPDYGACLYWYQCALDTNELLLFWDSRQSRLYVVESFF